MAITRLGLSGYSALPYGRFAGKTATETASVAGRPRRYTHTFSNGLRINGTRKEIEAAVQRFEQTTTEIERVVERPAKKPEQTASVKPTPSEILAEMPERVPLNVVRPPAPVAIPDIDPFSDDDAVLVLLLA